MYINDTVLNTYYSVLRLIRILIYRIPRYIEQNNSVPAEPIEITFR